MNSTTRFSFFQYFICSFALVFGLFVSSQSNFVSAAIVPTGAFVGGSSEGFESFPNGPIPGGAANLSGPASILGGVGILSGTNVSSYPLYIWNSIGGLGLGGATVAVPHDGFKGVVTNNLTPIARIDFTSPVNKFGGYWGVTFNGDIDFTFYDDTDTVIGTDTVTYTLAGPLEWFGWETELGDPAIAAVEWNGWYAAVDGLQVDAVGVPAPGCSVLACLGMLSWLSMSRRQKLDC